MSRYFFNNLPWLCNERLIIIIIIIFSGSAAQRGVWLHPRGFFITQTDAPQSVGLLWTSDQLVAETSI
jgi:hypothetical protein